MEDETKRVIYYGYVRKVERGESTTTTSLYEPIGGNNRGILVVAHNSVGALKAHHFVILSSCFRPWTAEEYADEDQDRKFFKRNGVTLTIFAMKGSVRVVNCYNFINGRIAVKMWHLKTTEEYKTGLPITLLTDSSPNFTH